MRDDAGTIAGRYGDRGRPSPQTITSDSAWLQASAENEGTEEEGEVAAAVVRLTEQIEVAAVVVAMTAVGGLVRAGVDADAAVVE